MRTVHKFPLKVVGEQLLYLPLHFKVLKVDMQGNQVCAWIELDSEADLIATSVFMYGTGHRVAVVGAYHIGSIIDGGMYVWHYYMVRRG